MSKVEFSSKPAEKLATINDLTLKAGGGSGKKGAYNIADVRKLISGSSSDNKPEAKKPTKRYKIELQSEHTGNYHVIDLNEKVDAPNRVYRTCDTKADAKELCDTMNGNK